MSAMDDPDGTIEPIELDERAAREVEAARSRPTSYWVGVTLVLVLLAGAVSARHQPDGADAAEGRGALPDDAGHLGDHRLHAGRRGLDAADHRTGRPLRQEEGPGRHRVRRRGRRADQLGGLKLRGAALRALPQRRLDRVHPARLLADARHLPAAAAGAGDRRDHQRHRDRHDRRPVPGRLPQ